MRAEGDGAGSRVGEQRGWEKEGHWDARWDGDFSREVGGRGRMCFGLGWSSLLNLDCTLSTG